MARTLPPHNVWVQSVSRGNRKSCPTCRERLEPGEWIWTLGEYVRGKWRTGSDDFCKNCFKVTAMPVVERAYGRDPRGWEFCPRSGSTLPAWLCKPKPADEDSFWRAIDAAPENDMLPVGVFADWLDERGDPRAAPLGWAFENGRTPAEHNPGRMEWQNDRHRRPGDKPASALPGHLFDGIFMHRPNRADMEALYHPTPQTRSTAYKRLCLAWQYLIEAGVDPATGLKPETVGATGG